jgi:broad specificity phosphatase PhoE
VSRLVLVRHAEPEEDARGRVYGTLDVGLSPAGREQARRLALALPRVPVYSSPRRRALETARALGAEPIVEPDLREIDFGELEGRRYEEIERAEPELFRAWMETPTEVRFPGGESFTDLRMRALRALESIRRREACAVVVTHGGVVRAGLAAWLEMPDAAIFRLAQDYCGVSVVDWIDETPLVRAVNASTRLDGVV